MIRETSIPEQKLQKFFQKKKVMTTWSMMSDSKTWLKNIIFSNKWLIFFEFFKIIYMWNMTGGWILKIEYTMT